jgi:hypothetical protein
MELPTTLQDIDKLISTQTQESLHLDYKDSRAVDKSKRAEISKDVSAFANSDGGAIIYGVIEQDHLPVSRDSGVDQAHYTREWLEQVVNSNISPRLEGVQIIQIPVSKNKSIYVIGIPKSFRGPHQAADKKYYKRFNFQSEPMEDYEINDIRSRQNSIPPLISFTTELKQSIVTLVVENIGQYPAYDVAFTFPYGITWRDGRALPMLLKDGAKVIPPGSRYPYLYYTYPEIVNGENLKTLDVEVCYFHPILGDRVTEVIHIDFMNYFGVLLEESELMTLGKSLKDAIEKLTREIKDIKGILDKLSWISSTSGLDLSYSSVENLKHVIAQDGKFEKLNPERYSYEAFINMLDIEAGLALRLYKFFNSDDVDKKLRDIEGIDESVIEKMKKVFVISEKYL